MSRYVFIADGNISIQYDNIAGQDRESTNYLNSKYWDSQPTHLKNMHLTDAELIELAEAGSIRGGRHATHNGKLVT